MSVTASEAAAMAAMAAPGELCWATVPAAAAPTPCMASMPEEARPSACPLSSSGVSAIRCSCSSKLAQ